MKKSNKKAIDLFCGCGGISVGIQNAGIDVIAGVDIESSYICSFSKNFPDSQSLILNLSLTHPIEFMEKLNICKGELFLLAGGPPCQGFSKNTPRSKRTEESSNNLLIKTYLDYCEALMPKTILIENVAEMKNGFNKCYSDMIYQKLEKIGYNITSLVLNSADFGVPQRRKRAFFLGIKSYKKIPALYPSHFKLDPDSFLNNPHISVWEAISDLPSIRHDQHFLNIKYKVEPQNDFQQQMRLFHQSEYVLNHQPKKLREKQFARISMLKPGQGLKDLPDDLKVRGGYSGAYGRLTENMIAPTITRWVFHPGSGRWGHPKDARLITIREAARLQSFPDHFEFVGSYVQQAGQLGNSVPPLLAEVIVKHIIKHYEAEVSNNLISSSKDSLSALGGDLKVATFAS